MLSGLDTLLQAARFLELQEQQQQQPRRLSSDVTIIPTNSQSNPLNSSSSVHTNSTSNNTISFIPSNSTSVSENRFLPPIGKISNGTVILTATGAAAGQNGLTSSSASSVTSSPARILSPIHGGLAGGTTTAVVTGLVPQGTTAYLTTTSGGGVGGTQQQHQSLSVSSTSSSPRHQTGGAAIVPVASGSRKRTISNASSHSSGGYVKDEPLVNGHSTAPPLVVISTNGSSSSSSSNSSNSSSHQKHHPASSLTIDLSTKSSGSGLHLSSTPPSSACSSSSSTLTISPVDDSQSSLNLSSGSSGYITSLSANSSSSLNLSGSNSGSSPLPITINGSVITPSHGSNSSPLPHDLVIVQQQQQQQINHLVQAGQQSHALTSTATLLSHVPTGGRRRTTSSNSNGVGTREVHNKLEKNRRAHLKECFEQLKKQLTLQPDEKKTSNLSILHAAIRHIQLLKRKEREYEHEMERLAKEKIAAQNRILLLKRELSQWGDVDFSRLAPDTDAIPHSSSNGLQSDRDLLNDPPGIAPGRNGIRYSSSSSLSSVATTASISNLPLQTTISPVLIAASSPTRASPPSTMTRNSSSPVVSMQMPLSLTTKSTTGVADTHNGTPSPLKFTSSANLPNGLNLSTSSIGMSNGSSSGGSNCSTPNSTNGGSTSTIGNGVSGTPLPLIVDANNLSSLSQSQLFTPVTATILTTGNGTSIQTLPLNLNVTSTVSNGSNHPYSSSSVISGSNGTSGSTSGLQIIGTTANGTTLPAGLVSSTTGKELLNGTTIPKNGFRSDSNKIEIIATQSTAGSTLDPPATKVIKLVNGNTIVGLTSVDKDKMMLSQVVQQGGIVMSPIQLLTSQGLRVIQQAPNGLATIELSTPTNVQPQSSQAQRITGGSSSFSTISTSSSHLSSQPLNQSSQSASHHHHPQQIQQVTGAQLHKLLISSTSANGTSINGITSSGSISSSTNSIVPNSGYNTGGSTPVTAVVSTTTITPELARLPGGAELNILPAGTNGATALPLYRTTGQPGKLAFVNAISASNSTGLTLKGADTTISSTGRTAVHVVTPIQTSSSQLSALTPVVVSRYDQDANLPGLFTTAAGSTQTAQLGKVVKTVGQSPSGLPLIAATPNAQYLKTVLKPTATMMVTVSSAPGTNSNLSLPQMLENNKSSKNTNLSDTTANLVLANNNSNRTPPPTAMQSVGKGEITTIVM